MNPSEGSVDFFSIFSKNFMVKRKIKIENIAAVSIANLSSEFVLHVPSEYDYRFSHPTLRSILIGNIVTFNLKKTGNKKFKFYFHDVVNLNKVVNTED